MIEHNVFVIFADWKGGDRWKCTGFHCESVSIGAEDDGSFSLACVFWTKQQCLAARKAVEQMAYCLSFLPQANATYYDGRRMPVARVASKKALCLTIRPALEVGEKHPITGELVPPCGVSFN